MAWTTPQTWPSLTDLTASEFNVHIRDNLNAMTTQGTYSPSLSNWTLGNGTLDGYYAQAGDWVWGRVEFTFGSTSSATNAFDASLPATANNSSVFGFPLMGTAFMEDNSATSRRWWQVGTSTDGTRIRLFDTDGTSINTNTPWTWATSDIIIATFMYEAA